MENKNDLESIIKKLSEMEGRINRIETYLEIDDNILDSQDQLFEEANEEKRNLELEIGQFWFAKVGIIVLVIAVGILLTLPFSKLPSFLPSIFGLVASLGLFIFSKLWKKSYGLISRYLFGAGFFVLFFSALRLHYWGNPNYISNNLLEYVLLLAIASLVLFFSIRKKSSYLYNIGILFGSIASLISGHTYIIFCTILLLTLLSTFLKINFKWASLFYWTILITYLTHFIWFINNPFIVGNKIEFVKEPYSNVFFLMFYLVSIAIGNILRKRDFEEGNQKVISSFFNSFGFLILFALITLSSFKSEITISFILASALFLFMSIVLWKKQLDKYSIFFFAIIGYIFLSSAIVNNFEIPELFIWLSWQSIIVVSTAIWYRSKIIILANFLIFIMIVLGTITLTENFAWSGVNVGIVALVSARILNANKGRLELKTETMRIAYLSLAFLILPLSTFKIIPLDYVGFAWLTIGLLYYVLSIILKNNKYRWMAILTLGLTIIFNLVSAVIYPENELQLISFLVVGIVLIIISILYTRTKSKNILKNSEL